MKNIKVVNWARKQGLNIRCRSGGHNYESFSVGNDVVVIDVSNLLDFEIDTNEGYVRIGAGYKQEQLYPKIAKYGFTFVGGSCGSVGVAGITLGGGVGYLQREYGLVCHNLVEAQIVDAFGRIITANSYQNQNLFATLRGAGSNNFGVVVSLTFKVHPIDKVTVLTAEWTKESRYEVIQAFQKVGEHLDNRYTVKTYMTKDTIELHVVGLRSTEKEMEKALSVLLKVPNKMNYTAKRISFKESVQERPDFVSTPKGFKTTGLLAYNPLGKEPCQIMFDYLDNSPFIQPPIEIGFLLLGGKIAENERLPSAYPHRGAKVLVQIDAEWILKYSMYANDTIRWVNSLRKSLLPYAGFGHLNYCYINIPNYLYNYFDNNVSWLKTVKEKYNPYNLFYYPQGI
ncbi:FAD-binding oxidoreductase [Clostridium botulinum]|uniref:FAD-dependent oxidoreductase n=1 Tax=Clostridium TaxID=1485 RepID=UPI0009AF8D0A|nr:FAD-binding protein [Clostridium botulinum]MBY6813843.1 FAD-binding protein [Clostridium botulinum]MBY6820216.1 FAD-binding protein [Clostridium botulinum]MBY6985541.1 FAD-binding protein [Clostridium botulinum]MBY7006944.1 FAD-binding protein [Clostridium botulinum]